GSGPDPEPGHLLRSARADSMKAPHGQALDERGALARANDAQAIGLVLVARQLGQKLVVADARAGRQARGRLDALADQPGNARGRADSEIVVGYIEVGFVEAQRFDVGGEIAEDCADLLRSLAVGVEPALAE